ncbi:hypothetical protein RSOLAG22IIIB_13414 [Rhizoctonia solani]|uniref:Uncharacterized protein n=1 Tax=Rhizoctonia solani TaxID=456999 RepID=A0A0K6FMB6_9AGAM|nr:hypothetical protein RSOLAG22IIIB_13414 [Rhizoctonia solani]
MPPKQKASKPPRPPDPSAHLTQAQRRALMVQARRAAPRPKRQIVSPKDSPEVAKLVSATSKQVVRFLDEEGVEDGMEVDGSGAEGESKEKGKGKGQDDGGVDGGGEGGWVDVETASGTEHEGEEELETANGLNRKLPSKSIKRRGRLPGSTGYTIALEWNLVKAMRACRPRTEVGWRRTAKYFNARVAKNQQRTWESLKSKYNRMTKRKKPTGDGEGSKLHDAVLETEMLRAAQEETVALEDDSWSESDAPAGHKPQSSSKMAHAKSKPAPVPAPTVLDLSSDSDVVVIPQTPPKKKPSHSSIAYHAEKVPEVTSVKGPPSSKRCKTDQKAVEGVMAMLERTSQSQNDSSEATGVAKVEIFGRDRTIERISKDLSTATERCHQLERQIDGVAMVMTMYGIPLPPSTSGEGSGPSLALALAGFLQARVPPLLPASSVLTSSTNAPTTKVASAAPLPAELMTAPTTPDGRENSLDQLAELAPYELTEEALDASCEASGSNLTAAEKGKLPVYLGN